MSLGLSANNRDAVTAHYRTHQDDARARANFVLVNMSSLKKDRVYIEHQWINLLISVVLKNQTTVSTVGLDQ